MAGPSVAFEFPLSALPQPAAPPAAPAPVLVQAPAPVATPAQPVTPAAAPINPNPPVQPNMAEARLMPAPGVPAELVGRTLREVFQIYGVMRQQYLQPAAPAPVAPAPAPLPLQQPAQAGRSSFWSDPEAAIERIVDRRVAQAESRVAAPTQIQAARNQIAAKYGTVFSQLEPYMTARLQGATPELLSDPATWENMFSLVYGQAVLSGQIRPGAPVAAAPVVPQAPAPVMASPVSTGFPSGFASAQWVPPQQFFTEVPGGGASGAISLTADQKDAARKMNMTDETYIAWMGGASR